MMKSRNCFRHRHHIVSNGFNPRKLSELADSLFVRLFQ
jgi:hypothetical protein